MPVYFQKTCGTCPPCGGGDPPPLCDYCKTYFGYSEQSAVPQFLPGLVKAVVWTRFVNESPAPGQSPRVEFQKCASSFDREAAPPKLEPGDFILERHWDSNAVAGDMADKPIRHYQVLQTVESLATELANNRWVQHGATYAFQAGCAEGPEPMAATVGRAFSMPPGFTVGHQAANGYSGLPMFIPWNQGTTGAAVGGFYTALQVVENWRALQTRPGGGNLLEEWSFVRNCNLTTRVWSVSVDTAASVGANILGLPTPAQLRLMAYPYQSPAFTPGLSFPMGFDFRLGSPYNQSVAPAAFNCSYRTVWKSLVGGDDITVTSFQQLRLVNGVDWAALESQADAILEASPQGYNLKPGLCVGNEAGRGRTWDANAWKARATSYGRSEVVKFPCPP